MLGGAIGAGLYDMDEIRRGNTLGVIAFAITSGALFTSLWWLLLGPILYKWPGLIRQPLHPFADQFNRRRALAISGAGLLLLAIVAGFIALYMNDVFAIFVR